MTWTAPDVKRAEPPTVAGERESLETWLEYHRATLLLKCQGLTAEQLARRAVPPSSLSLLGLVRHMAEV
ncbi:MAG TPA: Mini-circle protein, partial [Actinobacteria bacterium]|nr:Mini-circle protein [Actinomycetota bacterium]